MAGYRIRSDWLTCSLSECPDVMAQLEKAILLSFLQGRCLEDVILPVGMDVESMFVELW